MDGKKILMTLAVLAVAPAIMLSGCGHKHNHGSDLKYDSTNHWYECSCGDKKDVKGHEASANYSHNETHHWKDCVDCGFDISLEQHACTLEIQAEAFLKEELDAKFVYYKSCVCGQKGVDTFDVLKTQASISNLAMSTIDITYGDSYDVVFSTNSNGTKTIEYKVQGANDDTYTTTKPVNAGLYTARVSVSGTSTYSSVSETIDFEIKKYVLANLSTSVEYNGTLYHIVNLDQIEDGLRLDLAFNSENVGATPTSVEVTLNGNPATNYEIVTSGSNACTVDIVAKKVHLDWGGVYSFKFNNNAQYPAVVVSDDDLCDGDECEVVTTMLGDNVLGPTFTIEATGLSNANYEIQGESTKEFTILTSNVTSANVDADCSDDDPEDWVDVYLAEDEVEYVILSINEAGYYSFAFNEIGQGALFRFELYKLGSSNCLLASNMEWINSSTEARLLTNEPIYIEEVGDYIIKAIGKSGDTNFSEEGGIKLVKHDFSEFGLCLCGAYIYETYLSAEEIIIPASQQKTYFRIKAVAGENIEYAILHDGSLSLSYIDVYYLSNVNPIAFEKAYVGDLVIVEGLNYGNPESNDFILSQDGYFYVVIDELINTTIKFVAMQV